MLRAQIRAAYGRGVVYRWSVTDNLRVYLVSIEWMPGQKKERTHLQPASHYSDRLAAACDGRAAAPAYLHLQPLLLGEKGLGMRGKGASERAALAEISRPLTPTPLSKERGLPLPET
ncbi:hypothetical protein [Hyphomonas jannaschiana]|uniref:hypothetical protein n=1 Tax=Hyphomonas jannaschiana TaxID=86 RepID=UPI0035C703AB